MTYLAQGYPAVKKQIWALDPASPAVNHSRALAHRPREAIGCPLMATPPPQEKQDKAVLQSEVASLRQNNQRLQEESQAASEQLRKFAEIFCREKEL